VAEGGGLLRLPIVTNEPEIIDFRPVFLLILGSSWVPNDRDGTQFGHSFGHSRSSGSHANCLSGPGQVQRIVSRRP
jgi:hypothetical protein